MPKSRIVEARRLRPLILFTLVAYAALIVAFVVVDAASAPGWVRRLLVVLWFFAVPAGWWTLWRRSAGGRP